MPISSLMRITTELSLLRRCRSLVARAATAVLALGLIAAPARAADSAKAPTGASASESSGSHDAPTGTTFCNGIRLQDEIEVVNTRSICGGGNPDLMRKGLKIENYANCDDVGHRRWQ